MIDPDFEFNAPILGDLEIAVLEHVWRAQKTTAKCVQSALRPHRNIALGTVQSTLERLHRKHLLYRRKTGHAFTYTPEFSREQLVALLIRATLLRFHCDDTTTSGALLQIVNELSLTAQFRSALDPDGCG